MKKVKLMVEERLTYRREIMVEIPDDMDESDLEGVLDRAQRNDEYLSDFMHSLKDEGVRCPDGWDDDLSFPDSAEVECEEYDFIEEAA